jgi:hypothetical protein
MAKEDLIGQVKNTLAIFPEARNSDIRLTIELWKMYYRPFLHEDERLGLMIKIDDLFDLPREDNIKRIRATIQNEDRMYLPTNIEVFIARAKASDEWRQFLGYKVNKLPEAMTDADLRQAITDYLATPTQTTLL